eukprot:TRINITY_DN9584_c0_g1_i3.p1 TRINITY_DN9584_c0_g1~~TRINITY_DN9584_c0_g1_i3.p1  ORF type:complete len:503 (+),score=26.79 TRINITY_DN9584_c0_g1_i3:141-1511(+)
MSTSLQFSPSVNPSAGLADAGASFRRPDLDTDSGKDCTYFVRTGCCSFGNDCKFRHERASLLPLSGYTENGYPIRPGCEVCTFYLSTGWCNHWFSCSKDHDMSRLSGECRESLPPPTIMEQFHRFKYHSYTKEYKPLSTNHLPEAIKNKRWIVGNEYGQSALPRSAQSRILQSFKNGIPEDVKERLARFLPQDAAQRNMQLLRNGMGGYLTAMPGGALFSRIPQQYANMGQPPLHSKLMTPIPAQIPQPMYAAAPAAGYHPQRTTHFPLDNKSILSQHQPQRFYGVVPQMGQECSAYNQMYPTAYNMEPNDSPNLTSSPVQNRTSPGMCYYTPSTVPYQQPPVSLSEAPHYESGQGGYQEVYSQYACHGNYGYAPYGGEARQEGGAYAMSPQMSYPQHGWSYDNAENAGISGVQIQEHEQSIIEAPGKGPKLGEDRRSTLEEDNNLEESLFCNDAQ